MLICIFFFPKAKLGKLSLSTFFIFPTVVAIIFLCIPKLKPVEILSQFISSDGINPLEILSLFFSLIFISTILDEVGFFKVLAIYALKKAKGKQTTLFFILTLIIAVLTVFTSNDIIIITFTPFIIFFCKRANISPIPYLISEFVTANTWSMFLLIGNPTNIYISENFSIDFLSYLECMALPTVFVGIAVTLMMYLLFRKKLKDDIKVEVEEEKIKDKVVYYTSLSALVITLVAMIIANFLNNPMWIVSLTSAILLLVIILFYSIRRKDSLSYLSHSLKRLPYNLIPFLLSMFVIVLALKEVDITKEISSLLNNSQPILTYGISSFLTANLINNIPMSILFTEIIKSSEIVKLESIYATIIGSNVCAYFTEVGALAGIMWVTLMKNNKIEFSFLSFIKYGSILSLTALSFALIGLKISFLIM